MHPGEGRCYLHGGRQEDDGRVKSLFYATTKSKRLRELLEEYRLQPDKLDATPELDLARAMLAEYLERTDVKAVDVELVSRLIDRVSKAIKRVHDAQAAEHISRVEFYRILSEVGRVVDRAAAEFLHAPEDRAAFLERVNDGWMGIRTA